jgi:Fic family protein
MNTKHDFLYSFPPDVELETKLVLKAVAKAHRYLAELKGLALSIPNESILINTLSLQEAKDSSEIENIVTTHDELFKADLFAETSSPPAKETALYAQALREGFFKVKETGLLVNNQILEIQQSLEQNRAGFRKLPGTELKNRETGEVIYTPPQDHQKIVELMSVLERFINEDEEDDLDPLIKMALIHFQFESIHPFYDGNGRTGRIVNILYLVSKSLLNIPVLYLSRYVIQHKAEYYRLLQAVRNNGVWEEWVLFILQGIAITSQQTITIIHAIKSSMLETKHRIRNDFPKIYSQDLINNLFRHPYTKIAYLMEDLQVSRLTATRYLDQLADGGILRKKKHGRSNYYINLDLYEILFNIPQLPLVD